MLCLTTALDVIQTDGHITLLNHPNSKMPIIVPTVLFQFYETLMLQCGNLQEAVVGPYILPIFASNAIVLGNIKSPVK